MNHKHLVSVVIASYNMGRYLPLATQSVLSQTYSNIELHVVDDGSTDETKKVVDKFKNDARFHFHYQRNGGQASAKNKGIRASKGKYIGFLDADDMWTPDKLEKQVPCFAEKPDLGVVYTNFIYMNESGQTLHTPPRQYFSGNITKRLLVENFVNGMTSLVRRECFEIVGLFDESLPMGIDYDLWLRISTKYDFLFLDEITYLYRIWPGQMSKNHRGRYHCAERIMKRFINANRSLLDKGTIREAWAHTYVGRGTCFADIERNWNAALTDYLRAIRYRAWYLPAWKAIIKLAVARIRKYA